MKTTSFNLPDELITRLDSAAASDGRSRSSAARFFLEAALNADAALRQQASEHFQKTSASGSADHPVRDGGASGCFLTGQSSGGGASKERLHRQAGASDSAPALEEFEASGGADHPARGGGALAAAANDAYFAKGGA